MEEEEALKEGQRTPHLHQLMHWPTTNPATAKHALPDNQSEVHCHAAPREAVKEQPIKAFKNLG